MRLIDADVLKTIFDVRYDTAFIQERTRENKEQWNGYCTGINWGINTITKAPTVDAVVLPCKIGDTLYDIYEPLDNGHTDIKEYKVTKIEINITKNGRAWLVIENVQIPFDDFGKTVFLTREEAEAALAKMG